MGAKIIRVNTQKTPAGKNYSVGSIVTFVQNNELNVSKITDLKIIPDSVRARHILFRFISADSVAKILNDLKNNRVRWELVNATYNDDYGTVDRGGDLGYFTQSTMVESFDELCFNKAEVGNYYSVQTQFGQHIVQVTDIKRSGNTSIMRMTSLVSPIKPSKKTRKRAENNVLKFLKNTKNIDELEIKLRNDGVEFTPLIYFLESSEETSNWVKTAMDGEITAPPIKTKNPLTNKEQLIILGLRSKKGLEIRTEDLLIQYGFMMDQEKKSILLSQEIRDFQTLENIASKYQLLIKYISLLGVETQRSSTDEMISGSSIQNQLFDLRLNQLSEPIFGFNGIYVAQVYWKSN